MVIELLAIVGALSIIFSLCCMAAFVMMMIEYELEARRKEERNDDNKRGI